MLEIKLIEGILTEEDNHKNFKIVYDNFQLE